jgi:cytolysin (calcineurin-like family phosphatase)
MPQPLSRRAFLRATAATAVLGGGATTRRRRDVTFFVASDTHYGQEQWDNNESANKSAIALLNGLAGTPYPRAEFGVVDRPRAVLVPGDLTDSGTASNLNGYWLGKRHDGYVDDWPVNGGTGAHQLRYPIVEGYGNHDVHNQTGDAVLHGIVARNQQSKLARTFSPDGLHSAWDWDDVRFVNVGLYPGGAGYARDSLAFLIADLAKNVGRSGRPVVVMQHYGFDAFSLEPRWWTDAERAACGAAVKPYNVAAIFSGHQHWADRIAWNGINDYVLPRAKGDNGTDGVYAVRIVGGRMIVAHRRLSGQWDNVWVQDVA